MDTVPLVENQIEDGQTLLAQFAREGVPVRVACWVKPVEEDRWSLYIATPDVEKKGSLAAYRDAVRILRSLGDISITTSDIKLVGENDPVAQDAVDFLRRFPPMEPKPPLRPLFGGISVEQVCVYSPREVKITIYGLVFRGDPTGALHLSLEPHNPHSALEVETNGQRNEYPAETGMDWVVAAPEGAKLERNKANFGMIELVWDFRGKRERSNANEVWSLAKLGLHGFRFLQEPPDQQ